MSHLKSRLPPNSRGASISRSEGKYHKSSLNFKTFWVLSFKLEHQMEPSRNLSCGHRNSQIHEKRDYNILQPSHLGRLRTLKPPNRTWNQFRNYGTNLRSRIYEAGVNRFSNFYSIQLLIKILEAWKEHFTKTCSVQKLILTPQSQSSECNLPVPKRLLRGRFW